MQQASTSPEEARAGGRATGHRYWFGRPVAYEMPYNRAQLPAGFINASAEDLSHYLIAQLNGGRYGTATLLSAAGIATLHRPATPVGDGNSYGMGWFVGPTNGIPTVFHGGSTANFHANLVLVPAEGWGVVVLMNGENGLQGAEIASIADGVTSLLVAKQPPDVTNASNVRATLLMYALIVLGLQTLGLLRSLVLLRRWRREPDRRPRGLVRVALRTIPTFLLGMLWLVAVPLLVPLLLGNGLLDLLIFAPDLGYTLALSLGLALGWGLLRLALMVVVLRRQVPHEASGPTLAAQ
jgi:hypothetical protein